MSNEISITLDDIQHEDGTYSEDDLKTFSRATGLTVKALLKRKKEGEEPKFTDEEIGNMSDEEYMEKREEIHKAMMEGRVE